MNKRFLHVCGSVGISVVIGLLLTVIFFSGYSQVHFRPANYIQASGVYGVILSPATIFARVVRRTMLSWALVVGLTLVVMVFFTFAVDPLVGLIASIVIYYYFCILIGVVVLRLSRHQQYKRFKAGCCLSCGYDMAGLETHTCPECGKDTTIKPRWVY